MHIVLGTEGYAYQAAIVEDIANIVTPNSLTSSRRSPLSLSWEHSCHHPLRQVKLYRLPTRDRQSHTFRFRPVEGEPDGQIDNNNKIFS